MRLTTILYIIYLYISHGRIYCSGVVDGRNGNEDSTRQDFEGSVNGGIVEKETVHLGEEASEPLVPGQSACSHEDCHCATAPASLRGSTPNHIETPDVSLYLNKESVPSWKEFKEDETVYEVKFVRRTKITPTAHIFVLEYSDSEREVMEVCLFRHLLFVGEHHEPTKPGFWNSDKLDTEDKEVKRKYTPIYVDVERKQVHFIIRVYEPCQEFPDGGRLSRVLDQVKVGDKVKLSPWKPFYELIDDEFLKTANGEEIRFKTLNIIAAGTGIAPFVRPLIHYQNTSVKINLLYCNRSVEEILLKEFFDRLASQNSNINVKYFIYSKDDDECSSADVTDSPSDMLKCKPNGDVLSKLLNTTKDSATLYCGPPGFADFVKDLLENSKFENYYKV